MARNYEKTPISEIERKIHDVLADGQPHTADKLLLLLNDGDYSDRASLQMHITSLRRILEPKGRSVMLRNVKGVTHYQMVRLLGGRDEQ